MNYIKDVALYNDDGTVNVIVEICPNTSDKNELVEPGFDRLECVRQVIGKYPFYYGSFPQTLAGDKDPLDMILFTNKEHRNLDLVKVDVIGAVKTIDDGEQDDKVICVESDCALMNLKKQMRKALKFLKSYKGKNSNMKIEKNLASMSESEQLIREANQQFIAHNISVKRAAAKQNKSSAQTTKTPTKVNSTSRVRVVQRG